MTDYAAEQTRAARIAAAKTARIARRALDDSTYRQKVWDRLPPATQARLRDLAAASKGYSKLDVLLQSIGQPPLALELAYMQSCITGPYAPLVQKLTALLGRIEYDTDHRQITILRSNLDQLRHGQLFAVEICYPPGRQPKLYLNFVYEVTETGASFRGRGLRPLTIAGLRRAIRDARRI